MSVHITITTGPLTPALPTAAAPANTGASVVFEGLVRPTESDKPIAALDYTAYRPMADNELEKLARQTLDRFALLGVSVEHSIGRVPAGACSFRLRIDSPHRAQALEAMASFINQMKRDVPIWKRAVPISTTTPTHTPLHNHSTQLSGASTH